MAKHNLKKLWHVLAILVSILASDIRAESEQPLKVAIYKVKKQKLQQQLLLSGILKSGQQVAVFSKVQGIVKQ